MGAGHDGEERLSGRKYLCWVCGKNMEKVCVVQDVDELDRKDEMILVGYKLG